MRRSKRRMTLAFISREMNMREQASNDRANEKRENAEALKNMQEERMAADIAMLEGPAWREPDNE